MRPSDSPELQVLRELTQHIGCNPLLAQGSTGNSSIKLDGVLWIKASGRWMDDAQHNEILIALYLTDVHRECLQRDLDPAERYPGASLETAMHAVLPNAVVLHVHCVNTIAWAVRSAPIRYLTDAEVANSSSAVAYRYRELANERIGGGAGARVLSGVASGKSLAR